MMQERQDRQRKMLHTVPRPRRPTRNAVQPGGVEDSDVPLVVDVGEALLQQEREPEGRHRETEEADASERVVEDRVLADRRVDADGYAEDERENLGDDDELQRVAHRPRHLGPDRLQRLQRVAELVREDVLQPVEVAHDHRLVQVLLDDQIVDRAPRNTRVLPQERHRVAGVGDEQEAEERREEQYGDAVENPPDDVREHRISSRLVGEKVGIRARLAANADPVLFNC